MASVASLRRIIRALCALAPVACTSPQDGYAASEAALIAMGEVAPSDFEEVRAGRGRPVTNGDRVTLRVVGRYAERPQLPFADGPMTFISLSDRESALLGRGAIGARVGTRRKFTQAIVLDSARSRFVETQGMFQEKEFFRYRNDRGALVFETEVVDVCRPREIVLFHNSRWQTKTSLGCH